MVSEIETESVPRQQYSPNIPDADMAPPAAGQKAEEHGISSAQETATLDDHAPPISPSTPAQSRHLIQSTITTPPLVDAKEPNRLLLFGVALIVVVIASSAIARFLFHVPPNLILVVGVVITALGFDFVNGMNDSGNAIATVISTRALTPFAALIMAAILNLAGALLMEGVAQSIAGKIIVHAATSAVTPLMVLCGLLGAIAWAYNMTRLGLPISMSHSLIGGLVGVLLIAGVQLNWHYLGGICEWMIIAPVMGITLGWLLMVSIMWSCRNVSPYKMNHNFRYWQIISSGTMAFMHGSNDAQKAMGIITLALVAGGMHVVQTSAGPHIPIWVKLACATVIALGTGIGGRRVIGTIGHKIFKLTPVHGFAAETVASGTILLATLLKVPISTTHVISSSVLGVGSSKRLSAVRWGVAGNIIFAWIFTIPTCGMAAALLYGILHFIFKYH
jgi:PiT family inorganic phosphate transporter